MPLPIQDPRANPELAGRVDRAIENIATRLEEAAQDVRNQLGRVYEVGAPGTPTAAAVAATVTSEMTNLAPNLGLAALITAAGDLDAYREQEQ